LVILILINVIGYFGYSYIQKRNECLDLVRYYPATGEFTTKMKNNDLKETVMGFFVTKVEARILPDTSDKQSKSEHYSYDGREFKTKNEAISYCIRNNK
jgi:hypothetical protein